jgi:tungstate transport system substrate-binding protein
MRRLAALILGASIAATCGGGPDHLVVAAGTTVHDSRILDHILDAYLEDHPGVEIETLSGPTEEVLALGGDQAADLLITNSASQEAAFLESAAVALSAPVFVSRFVLVGPRAWRDRVAGLEAPEVFRMVAAEAQPFVSRGDGSGTHDAELLNWLEAGIDPSEEPWYIETGEGMAASLESADREGAVTLAERGTFLARPGVGLVDLGVDPGGLDNPYLASVVDGGAGEDAARELLAWLTSSDGVDALAWANLELFGEEVYRPAGQTG